MGQIEAVIFNLDGVLVTTDACHFQAWRQMAREHGIPFDKGMDETIRGKSRMDGLSLMLENSPAQLFRGRKAGSGHPGECAAGSPEADFRADSLVLVDLPALIARANQQQN